MTRETQTKKRTREEESAPKSVSPVDTAHARVATVVEATENVEGDDSQDQNVNLSSDIKGILAALQQVRQKAISEGQKKSEELLNSVADQVKSLVEDTKRKVEKERQTLANTASKLCKEYQTTLIDESEKYRRAYEAFCNTKDLHLRTYDDLFTRFEETKEKLLIKLEQQRKKEKAAVSDLQRICAEKIATAEQSVKRKKQDEKSLQMLRKSLGSIFDSDGSEEELE